MNTSHVFVVVFLRISNKKDLMHIPGFRGPAVKINVAKNLKRRGHKRMR